MRPRPRVGGGRRWRGREQPRRLALLGQPAEAEAQGGGVRYGRSREISEAAAHPRWDPPRLGANDETALGVGGMGEMDEERTEE